MENKENVAAAIAKAQAELEEALSELEKLPAFEPSSVMYGAHALSNYLNITGATLELLLLSLKDHPDPKIGVWLEGLQHVTNLMTSTVSQLMNASARAEERLMFHKVDLCMLVRRASEYYQRKAVPKQIRIAYDFQPALPFAWTDRVAVAAVLDNLLSNAVKYSPAGKRVWVALHNESGSHIICTVRDEGPGLSLEEQSKLFQRGVRLTTVPTGGETSTGYGLAVAKELMDRLGGRIWCESQPGQGASFYFQLPVYIEEEHGPERRI